MTAIVVPEIAIVSNSKTENTKKRKEPSLESDDDVTSDIVSTLKRHCTDGVGNEEENEIVTSTIGAEEGSKIDLPLVTRKKPRDEATLDEWHEALLLSLGFPLNMVNSIHRPVYEPYVSKDWRHNYADEFERMLKFILPTKGFPSPIQYWRNFVSWAPELVQWNDRHLFFSTCGGVDNTFTFDNHDVKNSNIPPSWKSVIDSAHGCTDDVVESKRFAWSEMFYPSLKWQALNFCVQSLLSDHFPDFGHVLNDYVSRGFRSMNFGMRQAWKESKMSKDEEEDLSIIKRSDIRHSNLLQCLLSVLPPLESPATVYRYGFGREKNDFPTVAGEIYTFRGYTSTSIVPEWVLQKASSTTRSSTTKTMSPRYVVELRLPVGTRCTTIPGDEYEVILPHDCKGRFVEKLDLPLEIKEETEDEGVILQAVTIPYFIFDIIDDGIKFDEIKSQ